MLEIGSLVDGKYKILNKVGQGGMSVVYLAMNEKANKQWAIKEVRKDGIKDFEVVKQGLIVETDMLKKLSHPNLPSIVDVIDDKDTFLIVMDYIQGNPLDKTLKEYGAQPQEYVIEWAKQICDVLGYLHSRKPPIIYRDMKPANLMLKPDGNITLIDFGTAREYKEKNIADTTCLGTIGYAAPEQFGGMGQTDARTDIYCLGATLYHLVTGMNPCEPPYEIKPIRQINPMLSGGLEKIILKCTQRDPNDRYQSCAELMYALEHYDEIDEKNRRKAIRRVITFSMSVLLTFVFAGTAVWSSFAAQAQRSEDYDYLITKASSTQDYYDAILTDPTRTEAYIELVEYLKKESLTSEEISEINQLRTGINTKDNINGKEEVLKELKRENPKGYSEVCYQIGIAMLYSNETTMRKNRFTASAKWFKEAKDDYKLAELFCEMSDCLELIDEYKSSNIPQTGKQYEEFSELWDKIEEIENLIKTPTAFAINNKNIDGEDVQLLIIGFINDIIYEETDGFVKLVKDGQKKQHEKSDLIKLITDLKKVVDGIDNEYAADEKNNLNKKLDETLNKINSIIPDNTAMKGENT